MAVQELERTLTEAETRELQARIRRLRSVVRFSLPKAAAASLIVCGALAALTIFALIQSNRAQANLARAEREAALATSRQRAAQSGESLLTNHVNDALLYAVSAMRTATTSEAYRAMNGV